MPSASAEDQDMSPSPPPRPTSLSPGIRASLLQKVYHDALSHTLRACSYPNFAACFPTPAEHVPESLHGLHRDFIGRLEHTCKTEFAELLDEREVIPSLNELDNLIGDAKKRRQRASTGPSNGGRQQHPTPPTPPHLLPPSALLAAHMAPFLSGQTDTITQQLKSTRQSNDTVSREISAQWSEMDQLVQGLELMIRDMEQAAGHLNGEALTGVDAELERAAMD